MENKKDLNEKDVRLLLSFLVDPNAGTVALVKEQLKEALRLNPPLKEVIRGIPEPLLKQEGSRFLEELRLEKLEGDFRELARGKETLDLEKGAILLASFAYPDLQPADISLPLDRMAAQVQEIFAAAQPSPVQMVNILRTFLFDRLRFSGNSGNYYDPDNSYLNMVLEKKSGIPITLSCVYLFVAWRLDLNAHGVGLPGHFVVAHELPNGKIYLDPFNGGRVLAPKDCENLVRDRGISFLEEHLSYANNRQMLVRMIVNLINLYTEQGAEPRAHWLTRFLEALQ